MTQEIARFARPTNTCLRAADSRLARLAASGTYSGRLQGVIGQVLRRPLCDEPRRQEIGTGLVDNLISYPEVCQKG